MAALTLMLLAPLVSRAAEPLVTDRPDQTESTAIVPADSVQIETGVSRTGDEETGSDLEVWEVGSTLVRVGLGGGAELRLGWDGWLSEREDLTGERSTGAGDSTLGAKIHLSGAQGRRPAAALIFQAALPTGADEQARERVDPGFRLALSHDLTPRAAFGYNLGAEWLSSEGPDGSTHTFCDGLYTASVGFSLAERLGAFVEAFGTVPASGPGKPEHSFDGGFTWLVRGNVQLDASGGFGLSGEAADWFVGAGASARFPR